MNSVPIEIMKELESQASGLDFSKLTNLKPGKETSSQYTEEWYQARRYKFTSSCIHKLLTEPRSAEAKKNGELSETAKTYIIEKIAEEIGGFIPDVDNYAVRWGNDNEDNARRAYMEKTGREIAPVGFCQHTEFYGGSPDNISLDNSLSEGHIGGLEIKCPYNSTNHLWHCLINSQEYFKKNHPDYYWQCMSHIITLDAQWCDFVSFDPRVKTLNIFIFRVHRIEDEVNLLLDKIDKALKHKRAIKIQLGI